MSLHVCPTSRVNPNVNCGLWVILMCQYRFIVAEVLLCWGGLIMREAYVWGLIL